MPSPLECLSGEDMRMYATGYLPLRVSSPSAHAGVFALSQHWMRLVLLPEVVVVVVVAVLRLRRFQLLGIRQCSSLLNSTRGAESLVVRLS